MKKINKIAALLLLIAFLLSACKDEVIVVPAEDFAPPRFNWRKVDINNTGFAGIWAADTNNVFLLNHNNKSLYIYSNGITSTHYIGEYYLNEIKGISNSEVYLFGTQIGGNMTIIKWNGGSLEYYPTDIFVTGFNVNWVRGCVVNSNEIWILAQDGISKFDGQNMTDYLYGDSLMEPIDLFMTNDNKLQYISERYFDTSYIQQSLYDFQGTGFVRLYNYKGGINPPRAYTFLRETSGYKFGLELNDDLRRVCIHYFTGYSFTDFICLNSKIVSSWPSLSSNPVGTNLQNFIFLAQSNELIFQTLGKHSTSTEAGILQWNGSSFSKEIGLWPFSSPYLYEGFLLQSINTDSYLVLCPYSESNMGNSTLYIGMRK